MIIVTSSSVKGLLRGANQKVIPPRRFIFGSRLAAMRLFFEVRGEIVPSSALIARAILSPSRLKSATTLAPGI
jgi:hypothetical protein